VFAAGSGDEMNLGLALREVSYNSDFFPRYYDLVSAGIVFGVSYTSAAVAVASATATGAFALFNPAASGVQLVLLAATLPIVTFTAGTTGAGFGFQLVPGQQPTATTPGNTPQNMLVGSAGAAKAVTFVAGTLSAAPIVPAYFSEGAYLDLAAGEAIVFKDDLAGALVIQPNSGVDIVSSGTLVANLAPSLLWAEIPLG
jgi:hypothetical protein